MKFIKVTADVGNTPGVEVYINVNSITDLIPAYASGERSESDNCIIIRLRERTTFVYQTVEEVLSLIKQAEEI